MQVEDKEDIGPTMARKKKRVWEIDAEKRELEDSSKL